MNNKSISKTRQSIILLYFLHVPETQSFSCLLFFFTWDLTIL